MLLKLKYRYGLVTTCYCYWKIVSVSVTTVSTITSHHYDPPWCWHGGITSVAKIRSYFAVTGLPDLFWYFSDFFWKMLNSCHFSTNTNAHVPQTLSNFISSYVFSEPDFQLQTFEFFYNFFHLSQAQLFQIHLYRLPGSTHPQVKRLFTQKGARPLASRNFF